MLRAVKLLLVAGGVAPFVGASLPRVASKTSAQAQPQGQEENSLEALSVDEDAATSKLPDERAEGVTTDESESAEVEGGDSSATDAAPAVDASSSTGSAGKSQDSLLQVGGQSQSVEEKSSGFGEDAIANLLDGEGGEEALASLEKTLDDILAETDDEPPASGPNTGSAAPAGSTAPAAPVSPTPALSGAASSTVPAPPGGAAPSGGAASSTTPEKAAPSAPPAATGDQKSSPPQSDFSAQGSAPAKPESPPAGAVLPPGQVAPGTPSTAAGSAAPSGSGAPNPAAPGIPPDDQLLRHSGLLEASRPPAMREEAALRRRTHVARGGRRSRISRRKGHGRYNRHINRQLIFDEDGREVMGPEDFDAAVVGATGEDEPAFVRRGKYGRGSGSSLLTSVATCEELSASNECASPLAFDDEQAGQECDVEGGSCVFEDFCCILEESPRITGGFRILVDDADQFVAYHANNTQLLPTIMSGVLPINVANLTVTRLEIVGDVPAPAAPSLLDEVDELEHRNGRRGHGISQRGRGARSYGYDQEESLYDDATAPRQLRLRHHRSRSRSAHFSPSAPLSSFVQIAAEKLGFAKSQGPLSHRRRHARRHRGRGRPSSHALYERREEFFGDEDDSGYYNPGAFYEEADEGMELEDGMSMSAEGTVDIGYDIMVPTTPQAYEVAELLEQDETYVDLATKLAQGTAGVNNCSFVEFDAPLVTGVEEEYAASSGEESSGLAIAICSAAVGGMVMLLVLVLCWAEPTVEFTSLEETQKYAAHPEKQPLKSDRGDRSGRESPVPLAGGAGLRPSANRGDEGVAVGGGLNGAKDQAAPSVSQRAEEAGQVATTAVSPPGGGAAADNDSDY